jgi:hypothetical protein
MYAHRSDPNFLVSAVGKAYAAGPLSVASMTTAMEGVTYMDKDATMALMGK